MADRIRINAGGFVGDYEFDTSRAFTGTEWNWIKKISGYMPLTIQDGFDGGDPAVYIAFAAIALHRAGKVQKANVLEAAEMIADEPYGESTITYVAGEVADADPPPVAPAVSGNGSNGSSGIGSSDDSARPASTPTRTGARSWDMPTSEFETSLT